MTTSSDFDMAFGDALTTATRDATLEQRPQYVATTPEGTVVTGPADMLPAGCTRHATVAVGGQVTFARGPEA